MTLFAIICLLLSFILYTFYIVYIKLKYRPNCISLSYYLIKYPNLFTLWIISISFLILPSWLEISSEYFLFLAFLSAITLLLVGIFPKYLSNDRKLHILGASLTCIISLIWNIVMGLSWMPLLLVILIVSIPKIRKSLFWIEVLAFLNIYISIIIKLNLVL